MKTLFIVCVLTLFFNASAFCQRDESSEALFPNKSKIISILPLEKKEFLLNLKKNDFMEIDWLASDDLNLRFALYLPTGKNLLENTYDYITLIAPESGEYKFTVTLGEESRSNDEVKISGAQRITIQFNNTFKLPKGSIAKSFKKINGYDIKIVNSETEGQSILLIEKAGKLKAILKAAMTLTGLYFSDDLSHTYTIDEKRSANLMKTTLDKTGEGTPDVAVEFYSGGAHCCFDLRFFELGDEVKPIKPLLTGDARTIATGRNSKGGLILETADVIFRYWNISFAGSPMPTVILHFKKGEFRPNFEAMKKPAPSLSLLQKKARQARGKLTTKPYRGYVFAGMVSLEEYIFEEAFWGEMLDLIYTGHTDLAWQYLDLVWRADKPGKAVFREEFKYQLLQSEFWRMIQEDTGEKL